MSEQTHEWTGEDGRLWRVRSDGYGFVLEEGTMVDLLGTTPFMRWTARPSFPFADWESFRDAVDKLYADSQRTIVQVSAEYRIVREYGEPPYVERLRCPVVQVETWREVSGEVARAILGAWQSPGKESR